MFPFNQTVEPLYNRHIGTSGIVMPLMDGWMDGWMDRMDRWMDRMDGWMDE